MTQIQPKWTRRLLVVAISAAMSNQVLALEAISDEEMSSSTGEGIAFLPESFSVRMNGPDAANSGAGTFDTGYIRLIPVGPLTPQAAASGAGKGDIFLYGLAISQSAQNYGVGRTITDTNTRFSRTIDSWGTAANPWLLKVQTETGVPDFAAPTPTATSSGTVSYLGLEAPLYHNNIAPLGNAEKSAYNLKMAFWADAFVRDPSVVENLTATGTQFDLGGAGRANRIRLQAIWDGFSVNGSEVKIFQTLGGATNAGGLSTSYNNTLGIAGLLRFNGGDGQTLRATTSGTTNRGAATAWTIVHDGCGNASIAYGTAACRERVRTRTTTDTASATWTPPATLSSVFRISTRETTNTGVLATPAINGGQAPTFDQSEGVFIYNLNVNLVLGSLYQPLTVGVAADGRNISLELARIPNKESIYKRIYTDYSGADPTYLGSTCNIYRCGATRTLDGVTYQGNTATHSSISIGSTEYNAATNTLTAHRGIGAVGISFGALATRVNNTSTVYRELENQERRQRVREYSCGWLCTANDSDWEYRTASGAFTAFGATAADNQPAPAANRNWDTATTAGADWRSIASSVNAPGLTRDTIPAAPIAAAPLSPLNNMGSAVIDGLLIQHLKFTTKGL